MQLATRLVDLVEMIGEYLALMRSGLVQKPVPALRSGEGGDRIGVNQFKLLSPADGRLLQVANLIYGRRYPFSRSPVSSKLEKPLLQLGGNVRAVRLSVSS